MARGGEPGLYLALKRIDIHATQRSPDDFEKVVHRKLRNSRAITGQDGLKRRNIRELWICLDHGRDAVKAIHDLRVDRMLDPQGAVLIERRDSFLGPHIALAGFVGGFLNELQNRLPGRTIAPGRQDVVCAERELRRHTRKQRQTKHCRTTVDERHELTPRLVLRFSLTVPAGPAMRPAPRGPAFVLRSCRVQSIRSERSREWM